MYPSHFILLCFSVHQIIPHNCTARGQCHWVNPGAAPRIIGSWQLPLAGVVPGRHLRLGCCCCCVLSRFLFLKKQLCLRETFQTSYTMLSPLSRPNSHSVKRSKNPRGRSDHTTNTRKKKTISLQWFIIITLYPLLSYFWKKKHITRSVFHVSSDFSADISITTCGFVLGSTMSV